MERHEMKWIIGGTIVLVLTFFSFFLPLRSTERSGMLDKLLAISMPRPIKEMILGFSLEGRSIRRELEMTANAQKTILPAKPGADSKNATKAAIDKDNDKKKQLARLAKARQAEQRFYRALQERNFRMRVVQESEKYRRALLAEQQNQTQEFEPGSRRPKQLEPDLPNEKKQENADSMTASAWKSLVLAQPTRENIEQMFEAYQNGQLDEEAYYEIVASLIKDNSEEKRKMGLWALTVSTSYQGFSMAVHLSSTESNAQVKKVLTDYMSRYNSFKGLTYLDQALRSQDTLVTAAAAQIITQGVDRLKSGTPIANQGRTGRIDQEGKLTLDSYKRLVPTLRWLTTNTSSLSQWAQNLLSQLQLTSTPA